MKFLNHAWRAIVHISTVLYLLAENIKLRLQLRYVLFQQSILLFKCNNLIRKQRVLVSRQLKSLSQCRSGEMLSNPSVNHLENVHSAKYVK